MKGIQRFAHVDPRTLRPHLKNWRKHDQRQRQRFQALLAHLGWAGAILVNETTGNVCDGHMRLEEALKAKAKTVPVLYANWTKTEEDEVLASFDSLGAMAQTNAAALASLSESISSRLSELTSLPAQTRNELARHTRDLSTYAQDVSAGSAAPSLLTPSRSRKPLPEKAEAPEEFTDPVPHLEDDPLFESSSPWGLPDLLPDHLCSEPATTTWDRSPIESIPGVKRGTRGSLWYCYGAGPSTIPPGRGGILGFFTEDFRFERAWNDTPEFTAELVAAKWTGVCAPDFSTWASWPFPIALHNLYRSRWCARFWQEAGIPIIPILQGLSAPNLSDSILPITSLPRSIPVAAIGLRTADKANPVQYWKGVGSFIAQALSKLRIKHLLLYGGEDHRKHFEGYLPRSKTEYHFLPSFLARRRKKFDS